MKIPSIRRRRKLKPLAMISVLSLVLVSFITVAVFAETDFDTPGITDNSLNIWNTSVETPDGDLAYLYDGAGKYPGLIRHLLKDALSGHIYQTKVKVYYTAPPAVVTVNTTGYSTMCYFKTANTNTNVEMRIGNTLVYRQMATAEQKVSSARRVLVWQGFEPNNRTETTPSPHQVTARDDRGSRVCEDVGGESYPVTVYQERCLTWKNGNVGGRCILGADPDDNPNTGPASDYNTNTNTSSVLNPLVRCGGGTCKFGDRSFSAAWTPGAGMGYEPETGLYYANVDVTLDVNNILVEGFSNQIRFKLNAPGSYAIGHQKNPATDPKFSERFGLGNQITVEPWQPNRGVKFALPFGPHCNSPASEQMTIGLYDADRGTFRNTYMYVVERDPDSDARRRIPVTEFTSYTNVIPQTSTFIANTFSSVGPGSVSTITFNGQKGFQYMLVVANPGNQPGQVNKPGQNVFSVGLPTDSIPGIINCRYVLEPMLENVPQAFENTPEFRLRGYIENNKPGAVIGGDRDWQVNKLVFSSRPGNMHGPVTNNGLAPCDRMRSGNVGYNPSCDLLSAQTYPGTSEWLRDPYTEATNYPAGTYICFMTSIKQPRWDSAATQWAHSAMKCSVSIKYPSLGVGNGDVRTGGGFDSCSASVLGGITDKRKHFGIVAHDYPGVGQHNYINGAALSLGEIRNFASLTGSVPAADAWSMQGHFARGPGLPITGGLFYGDVGTITATTTVETHCLSPVFKQDRYPTSTPTTYNGGVRPVTITPDPKPSEKTYTYNLTGGANLVLGDIAVGPGQRVIVRVTGDSGSVLLNRNILYTGPVTNIYELPQFVLLVDSPNINIIVADSVTRLDGIYAGKRNMFTCQTHANASAPKSVLASQCSSQLKINGAVILGDRLYPHRTAGHTTSTDYTPAELFNLRPDILLSDYADGGDDPNLSIGSQRELAPRY